MSIKEGVKETLIGLAPIRYACSNLYMGATLTFFSVCHCIGLNAIAAL